MVVHGIAYVELYTGDARSAVDYFRSALGFTKLAESDRADGHSVLLRQGEVRLLVTSGPAVHDFLADHGDGIRDIALTCDQVGQTQRAALAAGAAPIPAGNGYPVVSGLGDLVHTLLSAGDVGPAGLPPGHNWIATPPAERLPAGRIRLLDHIAICLEGGSLAKYADFYREGFGLDPYSSEYVDTGDQGMDSIVVRSASGQVTFTLVAPDPARRPGQLDAFLARNNGPGVQHLAFLVDDIVPTVGELRARGVEFLSTPDTYYHQLGQRLPGLPEELADLRAAGVLADRDEWGYLLQLFSRSPYERNTLFFELIQRRGSRGFGSANIRALYEAVERDRRDSE